MHTSVTPTQSHRPSPNLSSLWHFFWNTNKAMTLFFLSNFVFLAIGLIGMAIDPRLVLGQSTWAKLTKFSLSLLIYAPTMLWMFSYVTRRKRLMGFVLNAIAVILFTEMVMILFQGARAEAMHFNISTPLNTALWGLMSFTITLFYVISFVGFGVLALQKLTDAPFAWSLRLGMVLMLVGFGLGYLMTTPQPDQQAVIAAGQQPTRIGGHTVGAPDGGEGLALLGWSTNHGDLRIAHFVGIHGLQVLAFVGWYLLRRSQQPGNRLTTGHRMTLVWGSFVAYLGLVALVTWQALRGQSLIAPDMLTLSALGGLIAMAGAFVITTLLHARSTAPRDTAPSLS